MPVSDGRIMCKRYVSVVMGWRDWFEDIEQCTFGDLDGLLSVIEDDDTLPDGYMLPEPRPDSLWFHVPDKGCGCLWKPGNRANLYRLAHAYVRPEARGQEMGKALLLYRIEFAKKLDDCEVLDTFHTHDPSTFRNLGFYVNEIKADGDIIHFIRELE